MPHRLLNLLCVVCFLCNCAAPLKQTEDTFTKSYNNGLRLMELKNYHQAQKVMENILSLDSTNSDARGALARCYLELGRESKADSLFNILLNKDAGNANALIGLARCRLRQNKPRQAEAYLEKVLRADSSTFDEKTEAMFVMGESLKMQGQFEGSGKFYHAVLKRNPHHLKAQLALEDLNKTENFNRHVVSILQKAVITRLDVAVLMSSLRKKENPMAATNGIVPIDMSEKDSAYFDVIFALNKRLVRLLPDSSFRPEYTINRAAMAAMLQHALSARLGIPQLEFRYFENAPLFKDIPNIGFLKNPAELVTRSGLMSGWPDGTFRPNETVSGREAYEMIRRLFQTQPSIKEAL